MEDKKNYMIVVAKDKRKMKVLERVCVQTEKYSDVTDYRNKMKEKYNEDVEVVILGTMAESEEDAYEITGLCFPEHALTNSKEFRELVNKGK